MNVNLIDLDVYFSLDYLSRKPDCIRGVSRVVDIPLNRAASIVSWLEFRGLISTRYEGQSRNSYVTARGIQVLEKAASLLVALDEAEEAARGG